MMTCAKRVRITGIAAAILFLAALVGPVGAYESTDVEKGGEVSGTIKLKGSPPSLQPHKVLHNPDYCGETVPDETYKVNLSTSAFQDVVVSIEGISRGKNHTSANLVLDNHKCSFQPHVLAGMIGDSYEVHNSDPILHNTHFKLEDMTILNVAMPAAGKNIKKTLSQAGIISVRCDAHTFMKGSIHVFDHPYFAVSDEVGFFKIADIPPGKYKMKFWHDGNLVKERDIAVGPSEKVNVSVDLAVK